MTTDATARRAVNGGVKVVAVMNVGRWSVNKYSSALQAVDWGSGKNRVGAGGSTVASSLSEPVRRKLAGWQKKRDLDGLQGMRQTRHRI